MHVRMEYYLARTRAVVHTEIDAIGLQRFLERVGDSARCVHDSGPVFFVDIKNIDRMFFGYDEGVPGIHGVDIEECERTRIFIDYLPRKLSGTYLAEQTIRGHRYSV